MLHWAWKPMRHPARDCPSRLTVVTIAIVVSRLPMTSANVSSVPIAALLAPVRHGVADGDVTAVVPGGIGRGGGDAGVPAAPGPGAAPGDRDRGPVRPHRPADDGEP